MRKIAREQLLAELSALRPRLEREGVTGLALFGSRARLDNRPDSDIDVVIEVEEGRKFSALDLIGVGHIIEDNIGLTSSVVVRRGLSRNPALLAEVQRDQIDVF